MRKHHKQHSANDNDADANDDERTCGTSFGPMFTTMSSTMFKSNAVLYHFLPRAENARIFSPQNAEKVPQCSRRRSGANTDHVTLAISACARHRRAIGNGKVTGGGGVGGETPAPVTFPEVTTKMNTGTVLGGESQRYRRPTETRKQNVERERDRDSGDFPAPLFSVVW